MVRLRPACFRLDTVSLLSTQFGSILLRLTCTRLASPGLAQSQFYSRGTMHISISLTSCRSPQFEFPLQDLLTCFHVVPLGLMQFCLETSGLCNVCKILKKGKGQEGLQAGSLQSACTHEPKPKCISWLDPPHSLPWTLF